MATTSINPSHAASLASAEGFAAIGVGDTALARKKHTEAGEILERDMKAHHRGSEKQLLRFLAATQYYKGGHYQKAQELANKIDPGALSKKHRELLSQFLKDVKQRAAPDYEIRIQKMLRALWHQNKTQEALDVLKEHPYVVDAGTLATMRATLCNRIQDFRGAAIFFAAALRYTSGAVEVAIMSVKTPLLLLKQGQISNAWEYVQHQLELLPHPIAYVTASVVSSDRFASAKPEDRQQHSEEQFAFVEQAWDAYQKLPAEQQSHPVMKAYMAFGFETAAATWLRLGNKRRAKDAWNQAVSLDASFANPLATQAFEEAANGQASSMAEKKYLSERDPHFLARLAPEPEILQPFKTLGV
jgi:tetratricopeptide (TPR) repeat protein